jgi:hypothetical protein
MSNLYDSPLGVNTRKTVTVDQRMGPESVWLMVTNDDDDFETGSSYNPELTTRNSTNFQVVQAIQQWCEIIQTIRPSGDEFAIQVRANSVPLSGSEALNDQSENTILTNTVREALGGNTAYTVWNANFQNDDIDWS